MADIVGIRFRRSGRVHYCDPVDLDLAVGDKVTVETDDGPREGRVVIESGQVLYTDLRGPLDRVLSKEPA